jgi:hypothetical protein
MLDKPSGEQLVETVVRLLRDEVMPALDGALSFKVRVAANALELVKREIVSGSKADAEERTRLQGLLDRADDTETLNRLLCTKIREGEFTLDTPGLAEHLWATTLAKVAIDQPTYASYRRIMNPKPKEPR